MNRGDIAREAPGPRAHSRNRTAVPEKQEASAVRAPMGRRAMISGRFSADVSGGMSAVTSDTDGRSPRRDSVPGLAFPLRLAAIIV